jgi:small GTP-binding protein
MSLPQNRHPLPRVITLGDSGVGKTALIARMKTDEFLDSTEPTIGAAVNLLEFDIDSDQCSFQIWDTAGQELYRSIIPVYFKTAVFAILVFSITDLSSFQHLDDWLEQIHNNADSEISVVLVASKMDREDCQVNSEDAKQYANKHHLKLFFTSARTGQNVHQLMHDIGVTLLELRNAVKQPEPPLPVDQGITPFQCC